MIVSIGLFCTSLVGSAKPSCPLAHAALANEGGHVVVGEAVADG